MHIEPRNKTEKQSPPNKLDSARPLSAQIVDIQPESRKITLRIGERLLDIPLQPGFQLGERILYLQLSNGEHQLQHLAESETLPVSEKFISTEWAKLLDFAERHLQNGSENEKALWKVIQNTLPLVAIPQVKRTSVEASLAPILEQANSIDSKASLTVAQKILTTLSSIFPPADNQVSPKIQTLLGSLANNDFEAAEPILAEVSKTEPLVLRNQNPLRLLQPLQELDGWDSPERLSTVVIHKARVAVEESLAIPIPKAALPELKGSIGKTIPLQVLSVEPNQIHLASAGSSQTPFALALPDKSPWPNVLKPETTVAAKILSVKGTPSLLPLPDSAYIPAKELPNYIAQGTPLSANLVDAREFASQYVSESPHPKAVIAFAKALHTLDLAIPHGESLDIAQKDLALRWTLSPNKELLDLRTLFHYHPKGNREGELFSFLPEKIQEWVQKTVVGQGKKILQAQDLLEILDNVPAVLLPEKDKTFAELRHQLQWTQKDQETRHPEDRQQVFYFLHQGQLQKGILQFRREKSEGGKKDPKDSPFQFHVETRTPKLGNVRVDFKIMKKDVWLDFLDESGKAEVSVKAEKAELAKELQEIGLLLQDLIYRVSKPQNPTSPQTTLPHLRFLDIKA